jgi:hypothetical protein
MSRTIVILVAALLLAATAHADDACRRAVDLPKAAVSPCSGVLIPAAVGRECARLRVSLVPRLELKVEELKRRAEVDKRAAADRLSACEGECARLRESLRSVEPVVGPDPTLVGIFAGVVGAIAGGVLVYAITEAVR